MMKSDDNVVRLSEIIVGSSILMISNGTEIYKSMPAMLHLYIKDVDVVHNQAIKACGESLREPANQFYGDRSVGVKDKWGNQLWIANHIEDVSYEEMKKHEEQFRKEKVIE